MDEKARLTREDWLILLELTDKWIVEKSRCDTLPNWQQWETMSNLWKKLQCQLDRTFHENYFWDSDKRQE